MPLTLHTGSSLLRHSIFNTVHHYIIGELIFAIIPSLVLLLTVSNFSGRIQPALFLDITSSFFSVMAAFEPETPAEAFVLDDFRSRVWKPLQDIYEDRWDQGMHACGFFDRRSKALITTRHNIARWNAAVGMCNPYDTTFAS